MSLQGISVNTPAFARYLICSLPLLLILIAAKVAKFLHSHMLTNDVIVAGWGVRFTLSQFFGDAETRIMLPDKYISTVADELDAPMRGRIFYATAPPILNGRKADVRHFGQVEVTTYSSTTVRASLQEWREDLLSGTAGRVGAPFQGDYQLLALLEELRYPPVNRRVIGARLPSAAALKVQPRVMFRVT